VIVTVTLNPALDVTYPVDALVAHTTHRVREVRERPGGKGLNVARVLHALGEPVLATGLLGGVTGERVRALLDATGVPSRFVPTAGQTRRTIAVVDPRDSTNFSEPGPAVSPAEWSRFRAGYADILGAADVVVLAGSLPPGLPLDAYATLIRLARARGVPTVLDTSGAALREGVHAAPDIVKPNQAELTSLLHAPPDQPPSTAAVGRVVGMGARAVVASFGLLGLVVATAAGGWRAVPPEPVAGNPTGAGDACVAALARGLRAGTPWPDLLAEAVALSAAAVAAPVAGAVDLPTYQRLRPRVLITEEGPAPC
jgi:tagatose 6-phosphate kinase